MISRKLHSFFKGNYNVLLFVLFLLFIARPHDQFNAYVGIWKFFFIAAIVFSIFKSENSRRVRIIVGILAFPSMLLNWIDLLHESKILVIGNAICTLLFLAICAALILKEVAIKARVSLETLRGAICAYFLLAFFFSYLYLLIEIIIPGTFQIRGAILLVEPHAARYFLQMRYFSFTNLLSAGYGDIVAVKDVGQTACVIEMTIGHLYIAILISRLVSVYSLAAEKKLFYKLLHQKPSQKG